VKLSVIICAYNEKDTILRVIEGVRATSLGHGWEKEIIVVDNCSTDGTRELLQDYGLRVAESALPKVMPQSRAHTTLREGTGEDDGNAQVQRRREKNEKDTGIRNRQSEMVRVIFHSRNLGKGASIRTAIKHCTGDYAIIQDADLEYDPGEIPLFVKKAMSDDADAVYGSRTVAGIVACIYSRYYWGIRLLTSLTNLLFKTRYTDVGTASKMVRTSVLRSLDLRCSGFDLDFELSDKLGKYGYRIAEIPITYRPRSFAEGKKIRAKDGLLAVAQILKDWFCGRQRRDGTT